PQTFARPHIFFYLPMILPPPCFTLFPYTTLFRSIFFVLSGYLVTDHMLNSYDKTGSYNNRHFYLSRIKKLYPQLITVLWLSAAYIFIFQRNLQIGRAHV